MRIGLIGRHAVRAALLAVVGLSLAACTTVEGTNALTDVGTFEREVMSSNARGLGLIPGERPKEDLTQARAPLVLPRSADALPAPVQEVAKAQLPVNSDNVRIDASGLSEADLARLRNARIVDPRSLSGRPLTPEETRALTARLQATNTRLNPNGKRPLYMPPDEYFTKVGNADMVCRAANGQIVSINDAACPEAVRRAIRASGGPRVSAGGSIAGGPGVELKKSDVTLGN